MSTTRNRNVAMHRLTPDNDIAAVSDEDREQAQPPRPTNQLYPTGRRPSLGWLQDIQPTTRKFSLPQVTFAGSQPTTPAIEVPSQSRTNSTSFPWINSFGSNAGARLKEGVLPSPTSAFSPGERPPHSPSTLDGEEGRNFLLTQHGATPKTARSHSYSSAQGENDGQSAFGGRVRASVRHRPSKPSLLGESSVGLSRLREDLEEVDSTTGADLSSTLSPGQWPNERHSFSKPSNMDDSRARTRATSTSSPNVQVYRRNSQTTRTMSHVEFGFDDLHNGHSDGPTNRSLQRRFSEHVGTLGYGDDDDFSDEKVDQSWGTQQTLNPDALSRRHSIAHYSTHASTFQHPTLGKTKEEDEEEMSPLEREPSPTQRDLFDTNAYFTGYGPASRAMNASAISMVHPAPIVAPPTTSGNMYSSIPNRGQPNRRLHVVAYKCSRAEIYYTIDGTGLELQRGDLVICEGDRGVDLGQVTHSDVSMEDARKYKAEANEEHFRWLVMFSQYSARGNSGENAMLGALANANGSSNHTGRNPLHSMGVEQEHNEKPKMIKRVAQQHEIDQLRDKEGFEAKAKRAAVAKAHELKYPMEILDCEYQADHHKITFFYYAVAYVNFNQLVTDLFKQYKARIWMSAVNPASVVNPAGHSQVPPPSAIGPGAILHTIPTANAALSVGPGFGPNSYRSNDQQNRSRPTVGQGGYGEGYYPFSHQIPGYSTQATAYSMPPAMGFPQGASDNMFGRYAHPGNVGSSPSPANFGAWYPPGASPFMNGSNGASYYGSNYASSPSLDENRSQPSTMYTSPGPGASPNYTNIPAYNPFSSSKSPFAPQHFGHTKFFTPSHQAGGGHGSAGKGQGASAATGRPTSATNMTGPTTGNANAMTGHNGSGNHLAASMASMGLGN